MRGDGAAGAWCFERTDTGKPYFADLPSPPPPAPVEVGRKAVNVPASVPELLDRDRWGRERRPSHYFHVDGAMIRRS